MRKQQNPPVTNNSSTPISRNEQVPPWRASSAPGRRSPQSTNSPSARESRDKKVSPSKASGGIPDPTDVYLAASNITPQPLLQPQHLLVVIDLNGTLLYRPTRRHPTKFIARPNTAPFLKYCVDTFSVVIWSSAKPENVTNMCNAILTKDLRKKVIAVWGRNKFGLSDTDFNLRVQCYKRLTTLWDDPLIAKSHPEYNFGGRWDQSNTVLVDDSLEKARSEPFNLIEVPEFFGDEYEQGHILPQVHDYLNHLSMHSDVSGCIRSSPFKPQISP
ncbi:HAD-like protein [Acephala macrosclerotiorum]|nr:HAD-like protein [Acephala macrosclerotiorum]